MYDEFEGAFLQDANDLDEEDSDEELDEEDLEDEDDVEPFEEDE